MKFKCMISALTAMALAVPCMGISPINAKSYMPDLPEEIIDEFGIFGLEEYQSVENTEFYSEGTYNKLQFDGGYGFFEARTMMGCDIGYHGQWHECDSYTICRSADYPTPDYTEFNDPHIKLIFTYGEIKSGDAKSGVLFELNDGKSELFVIQYFASGTDFSSYEKIKTYESAGKTYDLYMTTNEDGKNRYYAVNTKGETISDNMEEVWDKTYFSDESEISVTDHLTVLDGITGEGKKINRYGILTECSKGIGNIDFHIDLVNEAALLPEEPMKYNDDGTPYTYTGSITKNLDGFRYDFNSGESREAITELEDGSRVFEKIDGKSEFTPLGDGKYRVSVPEKLGSYVSAGKEFDGVSLDEHNFRLNYEFKISRDQDDGYKFADCSAVVWLLDPYVRIEFGEKSTHYNVLPADYIATIMIKGEKYELYKDLNSSDIPPYGRSADCNYLFLHIDDEDSPNNVTTVNERSTSVPIYALIRSAEKYGLKSGKVGRISLVIDDHRGGYDAEILKNEITEDEVSVLDEENAVNSYVDALKYWTVNYDGYEFSGQTKGYMYADENGCFSASCHIGQNSVFKSGTPKYSNFSIYRDNNLMLKYKIKDKINGDHSIYYYLEGDSSDFGDETESYSKHEIQLYIVEKGKDCFISNYDDAESVGSYTAGGHKYDVLKRETYYKDYFGTENGDLYLHEYICLRKDPDENEDIEGTVNVAEHLGNIKDFSNASVDFDLFKLVVEADKSKGTIDVLKNDYLYGNQIITGDFNGDWRIDSMDIIKAKQLLINWSVDNDEVPVYADVDQNGKFELADVVLLQSYVLGKIQQFTQSE